MNCFGTAISTTVSPRRRLVWELGNISFPSPEIFKMPRNK